MRLVSVVLLLALLSAIVSIAPSKPIAASPRFPDFGFLPPPQMYEGRVFRLSQDYPQQLTAKVPEVATRQFADVVKNWRQYMLDVRAYCFAGNIHGGDVEDDWRLDKPTPNPWYHMPWQHYGRFGREGIHGLTKEAHVRPQQLAIAQSFANGTTYAVGFYNAFGGYAIGRVWRDGKPIEPMTVEFPLGTVICKLLFVDVPTEQVPWMNPPLKWQAYITDTFESTNRRIREVALVQMDIMVRHDSAPTGWLFGTFQYNGQRKNADTKNLWNNLVPVGLQWGNDPDCREHSVNSKPERTIINPKIKESVINPDADELPATHLGWGGRLNGPVDNPMSSCMSCHMTGQSPQLSQMSPTFEDDPPAPGSDRWMRWYRNLGCAELFDPGAASTDFSLQMAIALQNYRDWQREATRLSADVYKSTNTRARLRPDSQRGARTRFDGRFIEEVPIRRDVPTRQDR